MRPARFGGNEKHVFRLVFVLVFRVGSGQFAFTRFEPVMQFPERIGDVLQEHQPQHDMLVFRRVDVLAQLIGGLPQLLFQRFLFDFFRSFRHEQA